VLLRNTEAEPKALAQTLHSNPNTYIFFILTGKSLRTYLLLSQIHLVPLHLLARPK